MSKEDFIKGLDCGYDIGRDSTGSVFTLKEMQDQYDKGYADAFKEVKIGVEHLHDKLDNLNGQEGNLCLFCKTDKHNALGITHRDDCVIVEIRRLIRYLEEKK